MPSRRLRTVAAAAATVMLLVSGCSWLTGTAIPEGVPPPPGDPVPAIDTRAAGRPADQLRD